MGLFDNLYNPSGYGGQGGLLDFILRAGGGQSSPFDPTSAPSPQMSALTAAAQQPPDQSTPNMIPIGGYRGYMMPSFGLPSQPSTGGNAPPQAAPMSAHAQMPPQAVAPQIPQQPPPVINAQAQPQGSAIPSFLQPQGGVNGFINGMRGGGLVGGIQGAFGNSPDALKQQAQLAQYQALAEKYGPSEAMRAVLNPEYAKQLFAPNKYQSAGEGYIFNSQSGEGKKLYDSTEKLPTSIQEYNYYKDNLPSGQQPMDYATWSTQKARASASNITVGGAETYDQAMAKSLGGQHAALMSGVPSAQERYRDLAAMQGALDAIQKNGGSTGGMGQAQILQLKKTINAGANALGIENPFSEADISDKEFLTKFNRQIAGAQAKGAMGSRVTNFEMQNYLKANPGLEMSTTGNQRLIGIQSQIEKRNIDVGNAVANITARAMMEKRQVDPTEVQKAITDYDEKHHIVDPITGQDLTKGVALPEFNTPQSATDSRVDATHAGNFKKLRRYNPATGALE